MTRSLDRKLTLLILLVSTLALITACAAFILVDRLTFRDRLETDLANKASIVSVVCRAALEFGDAEAAQEGLESFAAVPDIEAAFLFTADGYLMARYPAEGVIAPPRAHTRPGVAYSADLLTLVHPVVAVTGDSIGTLVVQNSLQPERQRQRRYLLVSALVLGIALVITLLASLRFRQTVTGPILHLTDTVRKVTGAQNYSVRVNTHENDELGDLARHFNTMLSEIQQRDEALARHRSFLEEQVATRTAELQIANASLTDARDRAEAVSRLKTTLLDNLSHEFRTPVSGIIALADILASEVEPVHVELVSMISDNGTRLIETLTMVLDLTQLEAGEYVSQRYPHDLATLLSASADVFQTRAATKGITLRVAVPPSFPPVEFDGYGVRVILSHLLSNAVKFTPSGEIAVCASRCADTLVVAVRDTGIGIEPAFRPHLFSPFRQGSEGMARNFEGMGLGLTVVQHMVDALGGTLEVESTVGAGSCFTLSLPLTPASDVAVLESAGAFA